MSLMMVSVVLMMLTRAIACGKRIAEVLEEDIPGLEALALDPMMRQLCEEVIEPYYYCLLYTSRCV